MCICVTQMPGLARRVRRRRRQAAAARRMKKSSLPGELKRACNRPAALAMLGLRVQEHTQPSGKGNCRSGAGKGAVVPVPE